MVLSIMTTRRWEQTLDMPFDQSRGAGRTEGPTTTTSDGDAWYRSPACQQPGERGGVWRTVPAIDDGGGGLLAKRVAVQDLGQPDEF